MSTQLIKLLAIRYSIVLILFIIFRYFLTLFVGNINDSYYILIPMFLSLVLSPKLKRLNTEFGIDYELNWFSKIIK